MADSDRFETLRGRNGRFVDANLKQVLRVGFWSLICHVTDQTVQSTSGPISCELDTDFGVGRHEDRFAGDLELPNGSVLRVLLHLVPELMYVESVEPPQAWDAIRAAVS